MWSTRKFKTESLAREWMRRNAHRYQAELIFIEMRKLSDPRCAVNYRALVNPRAPR